MSKMKLFVWTTFSPDYTGGLAFAIAENVAQAMALVIERHGRNPIEWGTLEILPLETPVARAVSGGG